MMEDPFGSAPATDEAQAAPAEPTFSPPPADPEPAPAPAKKAPAKKAVGKVTVDVEPRLLPISAEGKHVVTLKGGAGFDAPWYVLHAASLDEVEDFFGPQGERVIAVMERIQAAAQHFVALGPAKTAAAAPQRAAAPAAAQEAPGGDKRYCAHGEMKFISGTSRKTGKPYQMFACSSGDRNNECPAQFLR